MESGEKFVFVPESVKALYRERFQGSVWPKPENIKAMSEVHSHDR